MVFTVFVEGKNRTRTFHLIDIIPDTLGNNLTLGQLTAAQYYTGKLKPLSPQKY